MGHGQEHQLTERTVTSWAALMDNLGWLNSQIHENSLMVSLVQLDLQHSQQLVFSS